MRDASDALKAVLAARTFVIPADLFTITPKSAPAQRWSTFDQDVSYGGQTWTSRAGKISRSGLSVKNTVEVPELSMKLLCGPSDTILGVPIKRQVIDGLFDGATVELDRVFMPKPGDTSLGLVLLFSGRMSKADVNGDQVTFTAKGDNVLMNQSVPKNVYQTTCLHTFCDAGCTLNPASFTTTHSVALGSTAANIVWDAVPGSPALYTLGKLTMLTGVAAGQVRTVRLSSNTGIALTRPLTETPAVGDTFSILQGCDRKEATCSGTYSNLVNFRGFPFVPPPEMAA